MVPMETVLYLFIFYVLPYLTIPKESNFQNVFNVHNSYIPYHFLYPKQNLYCIYINALRDISEYLIPLEIQTLEISPPASYTVPYQFAMAYYEPRKARLQSLGRSS